MLRVVKCLLGFGLLMILIDLGYNSSAWALSFERLSQLRAVCVLPERATELNLDVLIQAAPAEMFELETLFLEASAYRPQSIQNSSQFREQLNSILEKLTQQDQLDEPQRSCLLRYLDEILDCAHAHQANREFGYLSKSLSDESLSFRQEELPEKDSPKTESHFEKNLVEDDLTAIDSSPNKDARLSQDARLFQDESAKIDLAALELTGIPVATHTQGYCTFFKLLVAPVSSLISVCITYPFDYAKLQSQLGEGQRPTLVSMMREFYYSPRRASGIYYSKFWPFLRAITASKSITFPIYEELKRWPNYSPFEAALIGGVVNNLFTNGLWVFRTKNFQSASSTGKPYNRHDFFRELRRNPLMYYSGFGAVTLGLIPQAAFFQMNETLSAPLKQFLKNQEWDQNTAAQFVGDGVTAAASKCLVGFGTYPIETLQMRHVKTGKTYLESFKNIHSERGISGLWNGVLFSTSKNCVATAIQMAIYQSMMRALSPPESERDQKLLK